MNRRGFLKFAAAAPVAIPIVAATAPMQAAAIPGAAGRFLTLSSIGFGGFEWSKYKDLFGPKLTQWERDTRAFELGVKNVSATLSYAEKLPNIVSTVIEKTADLALDHLTELTEQKPQTPPSDHQV